MTFRGNNQEPSNTHTHIFSPVSSVVMLGDYFKVHFNLIPLLRCVVTCYIVPCKMVLKALASFCHDSLVPQEDSMMLERTFPPAGHKRHSLEKQVHDTIVSPSLCQTIVESSRNTIHRDRFCALHLYVGAPVFHRFEGQLQ